MRKVIALLSASLLLLATATTALAAKPDDVWRSSEAGSGHDDFYSAACGFDVWLEYRISFSTSRLNSTFDAVRTRTGPGGTVISTIHLVFRYPTGFEEIEDPDTGAVTLVYREVGKGSFVWTTPGDGVIFRRAGYAALTWSSTYVDDQEIITFDDEVYHGQMPVGDEDITDLVCAALG